MKMHSEYLRGRGTGLPAGMSLAPAVVLLVLLAAADLAAAAPLGSARLQIAGSRLTVSPDSQTVPFDVPTVIETRLEDYDVTGGTLPRDLRVVGDFTGPGAASAVSFATKGPGRRPDR